MTDYESNWERGEHVTSKGQVIKIEDMPTIQIMNTLNKYEAQGYDVSKLQAELDKREVIEE